METQKTTLSGQTYYKEPITSEFAQLINSTSIGSSIAVLPMLSLRKQAMYDAKAIVRTIANKKGKVKKGISNAEIQTVIAEIVKVLPVCGKVTFAKAAPARTITHSVCNASRTTIIPKRKAYLRVS